MKTTPSPTAMKFNTVKTSKNTFLVYNSVGGFTGNKKQCGAFVKACRKAGKFLWAYQAAE